MPCRHVMPRHVPRVRRPQYSAQQRNFLMIEYAKRKGQRNCIKNIKADFTAKYPGVRCPTKMAIHKIYEKQMKHQTCHNLNSASSPGDSHSGRKRTVRTQQNIDRVRRAIEQDNQRDPDDPLIRYCSWSGQEHSSVVSPCLDP